MTNQKRLHIGGRIPGEMVLDALHNVLASNHCKRRWEVCFSENHELVIRCHRKEKGREAEFEKNVQINVLEPINPKHMYGFINAEIVFSTRNFFAKRRYFADFVTIEKEFTKCFDGYPWPYRAFDNQK